TVRIDGAAAPGAVRMAGNGALLDLEMALVRDRFADVKQQEIVEENIGIGGERLGGPVGSSVHEVPGRKAVLEALQEQWLKRLGDREWRLLIPQVADIVNKRHGRIIEPDISLLRSSHPVDSGERRTQQRVLLRDGNSLGDSTEQRALPEIEHTPSIELDHH